MSVPAEFVGVVSALQSSFATTLQSGLDPFQQQLGEQGNRIAALEKNAENKDTATALGEQNKRIAALEKRAGNSDTGTALSALQTMITKDHRNLVAEDKKALDKIDALEKKTEHIDTATATMQTMITNDYKHFVAENKKTSDRTEALGAEMGAKMGKLEEDTFELAGNVHELSEDMKKETTALKEEMQKEMKRETTAVKMELQKEMQNEMQKAKRARTDGKVEMEGVRDEMRELRDEMMMEMQVMRDEVYGVKQQEKKEKVAMQREMAQMREELEQAKRTRFEVIVQPTGAQQPEQQPEQQNEQPVQQSVPSAYACAEQLDELDEDGHDLTWKQRKIGDRVYYRLSISQIWQKLRGKNGYGISINRRGGKRPIYYRVKAFYRSQKKYQRLANGEDRAAVASQQAIGDLKLPYNFKTLEDAQNARDADLRKIGLKYEQKKIDGVWKERVVPL